LWRNDANYLSLQPAASETILRQDDPYLAQLTLPGLVNRQDALLVIKGVAQLTGKSTEELIAHMNRFPGVARRFEQINTNLYSDYAHTPPKIKGALQLAHEVAGDDVVVVYEGLHNTRQHFIKEDLKTLFDEVKQLYIVPSYLAREDPNLKLLAPEDLKSLLSPEAQNHTSPAQLDEKLAGSIKRHIDQGDLVLCISAGGGGSLDEWLRKAFAA
jgi:UDP-N-acetylmuramate-alanine ligase